METPAVTPGGTPVLPNNAELGLADDFDSFLQLLTTQLTSQDPLQPMDANQFTEQLVQFSGVEQAIKTNKTLDSLLSSMQADQFSRATDLVGAHVEALGSTVRLSERGAETALTYSLARDAAATAVQIQTASGQVVRELQGSTQAGLNTVSWDGRDANGLPVAAGDYTVVVSAADVFGSPIESSTRISGTVDSVELADGQMLVSIGGVQVPQDLVVAVHDPTDA